MRERKGERGRELIIEHLARFKATSWQWCTDSSSASVRFTRFFNDSFLGYRRHFLAITYLSRLKINLSDKIEFYELLSIDLLWKTRDTEGSFHLFVQQSISGIIQQTFERKKRKLEILFHSYRKVATSPIFSSFTFQWSILFQDQFQLLKWQIPNFYRN